MMARPRLLNLAIKIHIDFKVCLSLKVYHSGTKFKVWYETRNLSCKFQRQGRAQICFKDRKYVFTYFAHAPRNRKVE